MPETSLATREPGSLMLMPVMSIQQAVERYGELAGFVSKLMKVDIDFGAIPGAGDKKTLLKPGAEKLATFFGLTKRFILVEKTEDWMGAEHNGEPFFNYLYRCALYSGDILIAESDASANSFESKYRYRKGERTCPECGAAAIIKGKTEYGGGWVCFGKKGGCGAKFGDGDSDITSQIVGRILNPDICDQVNTLQKMAQKRALVGAVLLAVNASEFFTQDMEDFMDDEGGSVPTGKPSTTKRNNSQPARQAQSSPAETQLNDLLFAYCKKEKKNEKAAQAYFDAMFGKLSFEQKQERAIDLGLLVIQEQEPDRTELLDSIDSLCERLGDLGIKAGDTTNVINAMADHKPLPDCDTEILIKIEARLKGLLEKQQAA
jgi:hypothetical protein